MSNNEVVTYTCPECKYTNIWTRTEIQSRGKQIVFCDINNPSDRYSLPCKNPKSPRCPGRYEVDVEQRKDER